MCKKIKLVKIKKNNRYMSVIAEIAYNGNFFYQGGGINASHNFKRFYDEMIDDNVTQREYYKIYLFIEKGEVKTSAEYMELFDNIEETPIAITLSTDEDIKKIVAELNPKITSNDGLLQRDYGKNPDEDWKIVGDYNLLNRINEIFKSSDYYAEFDEEENEITIEGLTTQGNDRGAIELEEYIKQNLTAVPTKIIAENIAEFYPTMSDEEMYKNSMLISISLHKRYGQIIKTLHFPQNETYKHKFITNKSMGFNSFIISWDILGIKDTLKPVDEYIAEIKAGSEYKEHVALAFHRKNSDTNDLKILKEFLDLYDSCDEDFKMENPIFSGSGLEFFNIQDFSLTDSDNSYYKGNDLRDYLNLTGYEDLEYLEYDEVSYVLLATLKDFFE